MEDIGRPCIVMISLLTHTVAQSTRPSFRLKINNQPLKKFLSLAVSLVKVVKNSKILTFKVNFLCQKLWESLKKIIGEYQFRPTFFENKFLLASIFKPL